MLKKIILFLSIAIGSGILIVNIYTSVVDATSWGSNIPTSIQTAREYFRVVNPGTFFRVASPAAQLIALLALVLYWKSNPDVRKYLIGALVFYILTDAFTFAYFYPRNAIMFETGTDPAALTKAWSEWNTMNWVRSGVVFVGVFFSFISLDKIYSKK